MGTGFPVDDDGWWSTFIGAEEEPHGVSAATVATCVKPARELSPVPPMTAMLTGSGMNELGLALSTDEWSTYHRNDLPRWPF